MEGRSQGSATKELEKLDTVLTIHISLQLCHAPVQFKPILSTNPVRVLDEASSAVSAAPQEMRTVSPIASSPHSLPLLTVSMKSASTSSCFPFFESSDRHEVQALYILRLVLTALFVPSRRQMLANV